MVPQTETGFPTVPALLKAYWPILLITALPFFVFLILSSLTGSNPFWIGYIILIILSIVTWLIQIGLNLHIVDNHLENPRIKTLLSSGASFWPTIFRASLLLGAASLLIMLPLLFGLRSMGENSHRLAQVAGAMVTIKWGLLLEPFLYRDRCLVMDAWKAAWKVKLSQMPTLLILFTISAAIGLFPYFKLSLIYSFPIGIASMFLVIVIDLMALRFVCTDGLGRLDRIRIPVVE